MTLRPGGICYETLCDHITTQSHDSTDIITKIKNVCCEIEHFSSKLMFASYVGYVNHANYGS